MNDLELKAAAKATAARVIGPLARLLLDVGLCAKDFQEIATMEFLRAAISKGESTVPQATSNSAIAAVTGLTRRDVARLRNRSANSVNRDDVARHRVERVLSAWCHDPEFQDDSGNPARLALRGTKLAFNVLVRKHSTDPRARTILRELERVKAVRRHADGTVEVLRRTYAPLTFSSDGINDIGQQSHDQLMTLVHNLSHPKRPLYQRRAGNPDLTENQAAILERYIAQQGDALMDALDSALSDPPADPSATGNHNSVRLGVGFYMVRDPIENKTESTIVKNMQSIPRTPKRRVKKTSHKQRRFKT